MAHSAADMQGLTRKDSGTAEIVVISKATDSLEMSFIIWLSADTVKHGDNGRKLCMRVCREPRATCCLKGNMYEVPTSVSRHSYLHASFISPPFSPGEKLLTDLCGTTLHHTNWLRYPEHKHAAHPSRGVETADRDIDTHDIVNLKGFCTEGSPAEHSGGSNSFIFFMNTAQSAQTKIKRFILKVYLLEWKKISRYQLGNINIKNNSIFLQKDSVVMKELRERRVDRGAHEAWLLL